MSTKKFYTDVEIKSDIILDNASIGTVPVIDAAKKIVSSTVTTTELGRLSGVTSSVQGQLDAEVAARIAADAAEVTARNAAIAAAGANYVPLTQKGAANGVATLNGAGQVPAAQLPSYVDDVLEFADLASLPAVGETGKIYVTLNTNKTYRWSGSAYIEISASDVNSVNSKTGVVVLTTTDIAEGTNLYFTDERAQDAVGTILTDTNTVDFTYNDAANTIIADVKTQLSITSDASGIKLSGDSATPGNGRYYGTNGTGTKGFYAIPVQGSAGDIQETSFALSNNVATATNITGFSFSTGVVRSFDALVSIEIVAGSPLYEVYRLQGIQKGASFDMSIESTGDNSLISFTITNSGQIQYTSGTYAGFTSGLIKFRAITTTV